MSDDQTPPQRPPRYIAPTEMTMEGAHGRAIAQQQAEVDAYELRQRDDRLIGTLAEHIEETKVLRGTVDDLRQGLVDYAAAAASDTKDMKAMTKTLVWVAKVSLAVAVIALIVALLAGCGGTASPSVTTAKQTPVTTARTVPTAPTKAAYIAEADGICKIGGEREAPLLNEYDQVSASGGNYSEAASLITRADAIKLSELVKLRALPSPPGQQAVTSRIWRTLGEFISQFQHVADAMRAQNLSTVLSLESSVALVGGRYEGLAQAYGFHSCGTEHS